MLEPDPVVDRVAESVVDAELLWLSDGPGVVDAELLPLAVETALAERLAEAADDRVLDADPLGELDAVAPADGEEDAVGEADPEALALAAALGELLDDGLPDGLSDAELRLVGVPELDALAVASAVADALVDDESDA